MKRTLVALAALAVGGAASAQSSVTLFGVVDAAVSSYSNKSENVGLPTLANTFYVDSIKVKRTVLANSAYNSSRVGFRGTEDSVAAWPQASGSKHRSPTTTASKASRPLPGARR